MADDPDDRYALPHAALAAVCGVDSRAWPHTDGAVCHESTFAIPSPIPREREMNDDHMDDRWQELIELREDMERGHAVLPMRISGVDGSRVEASPKRRSIRQGARVRRRLVRHLGCPPPPRRPRRLEAEPQNRRPARVGRARRLRARRSTSPIPRQLFVGPYALSGKRTKVFVRHTSRHSYRAGRVAAPARLGHDARVVPDEARGSHRRHDARAPAASAVGGASARASREPCGRGSARWSRR